MSPAERKVMQMALNFIIDTNKSTSFWRVPGSELNKTVFELRAVLARPEPKPVALPDFPESISLADLEYARNTPADWSDDYRDCWQKLQVCEHNKMMLRKYAHELRQLYTAPPPYIAPEGYALISIEMLKHWGVYEQISAACRYPVPKFEKEHGRRTDQQIVDQTEELAVWLLSRFYDHDPDPDTLMRESSHPFAERCWAAACHIQEMLTATDPENSVAELDEDDEEREPAYCPHGKVEGRYCHDCGVIEQAEMRGEL